MHLKNIYLYCQAVVSTLDTKILNRHCTYVQYYIIKNAVEKQKSNKRNRNKTKKMLETITCEFMILVVLRFFRLTGDCATVQIFFLFVLDIIDFSFILSIVTNHSFFLRLVIISCHFRVIYYTCRVEMVLCVIISYG